MDLNSPFFDRIRAKPRQEPAPAPSAAHPACDHAGCPRPGEFRAPMGRLREGQYFCFCLDHVREYNATYNYFSGMNDADLMKYQKEATIGHRPTWAMGVNRNGRNFREDSTETPRAADPLARFRSRARGRPAPAARPEPRYGVAALKALGALGLDEAATPGSIKARYKELVKRLHPDANGGDRSSEDKLREIIGAYNYLRSTKHA